MGEGTIMSGIRKATIDDLDQVLFLWKKLIKDQMSQDVYFKGDMPLERDRRELEQILTSEWNQIFLYIEEEKPVGFIEVEKHQPDFNFFHDYYAYVLHFYIEEAYRKVEVSMSLYNSVITWAKEKECHYLEADVFAFNTKTRALLENVIKMKPYRTRLVKDISNIE